MKALTLLLLLLVENDIARVASQIDSTVGVAAVNLETGKRISILGSERFPMGSVYKFPIAIEVLRQVDAGKLRLTDDLTIQPSEFGTGHSPIRDKAQGKTVRLSIGALLESMLGQSDNTACDVLLKIVTPEAVTRLMNGIRVDRTEKQISTDIRKHGAAHYSADPRDTATPDAMVELLTRVAQRKDGLTPASHDLMMRIMSSSPRNRIKEGLPESVSVAHKSGQMPGVRNDVGIVDGRIVIAVFTKGGARSDEDLRGEVISQIARRVYDELTAPEARGSTTRRP